MNPLSLRLDVLIFNKGYVLYLEDPDGMYHVGVPENGLSGFEVVLAY